MKIVQGEAIRSQLVEHRCVGIERLEERGNFTASFCHCRASVRTAEEDDALDGLQHSRVPACSVGDHLQVDQLGGLGGARVIALPA